MPTKPPTSPDPEPDRRAGWIALSLGVLVFSSRLWLIATWGTAIPYWDEWDADAALYRAWLTDHLTWSDLFAPHNEHRITLTRLANLGLFVACGRWAPLAGLLLNAALHASTAAILAWMFWRSFSPPARLLAIAGLALLFTAPAGWQNALWGFQSQVYFASLLTVAGLVVIARSALAAPVWWSGFALLTISLFSNAGALLGLAAAFVASPWVGASLRARWVASGALLAAIVLGLLLRVDVPHHAGLRASSVAQFLSVFTRALSWPHVDSPFAWLVLQAPLAALCAWRWKTGQSFAAAERTALALGVFACLHAAAIAHSRGAGLIEARALSRYQDPLILGAAAQLFAAVRLATLAGPRARLLALGWGGATALGLIALTSTNLTFHLPFKLQQDRTSLAMVRRYVMTRNPAELVPGPGYTGPHPNPQAVQRVLDDAVLRPFLPRSFSTPPATADEPPHPLLAHARSIAIGAFLLFVAVLIATQVHPPSTLDRSRVGASRQRGGDPR
jgi:hypothetical protein